MNYYDRLAALGEYAGASRHAERICAEIRFLSYLSRARDGAYNDLLDRAAGDLLKSAGQAGVITEEAADKAEKALLSLAAEAKGYKVHLVAHAHIDMNWLWGYEETAAITLSTFRTMLDLLDRYPQFTFSQSQASTYEIIEKYAPELLPRIAAYIKAGRWELSGATWVENDENMPSAEALLRQTFYARRFYKQLFGEDAPLPRLDFQPDTFGHTAAIPDLLAAAGVDRMYRCRGNDGSESVYIWRGNSGAETLCFCDPHWYSAGISPDLFDRVPEACGKYGVRSWLTVYGVGDHGGGPTAEDIEKLTEYAAWPLFPSLVFSTYDAFFSEIEKDKEKLPVVTGECNFVFSGCYSSKSEIKKQNALCEARLCEAEALSALSSVWTGAADDSHVFETAWRKLLFLHFHDILPGSGLKVTSEWASGSSGEVLAAASCRADVSMRAIAERISLPGLQSGALPDGALLGAGGGYEIGAGRESGLSVSSGVGGKKRAFHLFNTTARDFEGVCRLTVWNWDFDAGRAAFTDTDGNRIESAPLGGSRGYWGHEYKTFLLYMSVPALGYTTVFLDEEERQGLPGIPVFYNRTISYPGETIVLENDRIRAVFDRKTCELLEIGSGDGKTRRYGIGCFRASEEDARAGMQAWKEGFLTGSTVLNANGSVRVTEHGANALRSSLSYELSFGAGSALKVNIELLRGESMLRFTVDADYYEKGDAAVTPRLDFVYAMNEKPEGARCGVPAGVIDRPVLPHDVPAFYMTPLGVSAPVPTLLAIGKYAFRCSGTALSLTLLRASAYPDPLPEYGSHRIVFALAFGDEPDEERADAYRERLFFPPLVCPAVNGAGDLPASARFAGVEGAELLSLKRSADGKGVILRLTSSADAEKNALVRFFAAPRAVYLTDLHEERRTPLCAQDGAVSLSVKPSEIVTLIAFFDRPAGS